MLYYALIFLVVGVISRSPEFGRGIRGGGSDFLGPVLGRDRVAGDSSGHGSFRPGLVSSRFT